MCEQPISDVSEFLRGQRHCQQGLPHEPQQHPDYDRGYYAEYAMQEVVTAQTAYRESRCGH